MFSTPSQAQLPFKLWPNYQNQGYEWLMDKWMSPKGKIRLNNPNYNRYTDESLIDETPTGVCISKEKRTMFEQLFSEATVKTAIGTIFIILIGVLIKIILYSNGDDNNNGNGGL